MNFVTDSEYPGRIEFGKKWLKGAEVSGSGSDAAVEGGGDDGNFPRGDAIGERKFHGGMASPIGDDFGPPKKRFREIFAKARGGKGHFDLAFGGAGFGYEACLAAGP